MCVSEGVEPCSCRVTASFSSSEGSHAFTGGRPARPTGGQASNCLVLTWRLGQEHRNTHTHQWMKRCQNSAFVYFQWFPWRCYVSFRLHIAFWFCRGCMLAGGPVVWMPEHVSGESVPSMKLSWAWTENHHSDAAVESIKCSSRPGLSQKNHCHVVMGITAPRLGVCLGFYFFIFFRGHILLCKYFDIRSLMYFSFISEQLRNFWPCHMIKLWELYSRFGWLWTFLCAAFRHSHARLKR